MNISSYDLQYLVWLFVDFDALEDYPLIRITIFCAYLFLDVISFILLILLSSCGLTSSDSQSDESQSVDDCFFNIAYNSNGKSVFYQTHVELREKVSNPYLDDDYDLAFSFLHFFRIIREYRLQEC
ncbi:unnamed protein product, partial [Mesorhabditis belari]|uniref:Uncharacterized protein n=1 Tax=Mesorhabditis belari TaxID=2138241 RepID=A0AAF3ELM6_9BILA